MSKFTAEGKETRTQPASQGGTAMIGNVRHESENIFSRTDSPDRHHQQKLDGDIRRHLGSINSTECVSSLEFAGYSLAFRQLILRPKWPLSRTMNDSVLPNFLLYSFFSVWRATESSELGRLLSLSKARKNQFEQPRR